jgi:hypothetical protein
MSALTRFHATTKRTKRHWCNPAGHVDIEVCHPLEPQLIAPTGDSHPQPRRGERQEKTMNIRWIKYRMLHLLGWLSGERYWLSIGNISTANPLETVDQRWFVSTSQYCITGNMASGHLTANLENAKTAIDSLIVSAGYKRVTKYVTKIGDLDPQFANSILAEAVIVRVK